MQTLKEQLQGPIDEVDEVVSLYGGDTRAAIRALLEDCHHFHGQLVLANLATSRGFTRGWQLLGKWFQKLVRKEPLRTDRKPISAMLGKRTTS